MPQALWEGHHSRAATLGADGNHVPKTDSCKCVLLSWLPVEDVYGHNCMASEEGHATLCDYGAGWAGAFWARQGGSMWLAKFVAVQQSSCGKSWSCPCCSSLAGRGPCLLIHAQHLHVYRASTMPRTAGASFPYHKSGPVRYEAMEVGGKYCCCLLHQRGYLLHPLALMLPKTTVPLVLARCTWHWR